MPQFRKLEDADLKNKIVILRADLNVPMKDGVVTDTSRLQRLVPTLNFLKDAKTVVLSHFGRPEGRFNPKYSLAPVAQKLEEILQKKIAFAPDCRGNIAREAIENLKEGEILVLENTRFYPEEEANDPAFAKELAQAGDIFVNDAFSAAHRAHASTEGIAHHKPTYAGLLMQEELLALEKALEKPEKPVAAVVGGAKISTKLDLLENLVTKVDFLILGGGMANTFLAAQGVFVGASLYEKDMLETARRIGDKAATNHCRIVLPTDVCVAREFKTGAENEIVGIQDIQEDQMILDLGPASIEDVNETLETCRTVVWNGPLGVFEMPPFDKGTCAVAEKVAELTETGQILSVAGGGDTVAALSHAKVADKVSYLSSAGGAFLEWLEGKTLPGVAALGQGL